MKIAQLNIPYQGGTIAVPVTPGVTQATFTDLGGVISQALKFLFPLSGLILFAMIIIAGFQLLTSAGEPKKMEAAKQRLTWGIIGFVVIFVSFWIMKILEFLLGIQIL